MKTTIIDRAAVTLLYLEGSVAFLPQITKATL